MSANLHPKRAHRASGDSTSIFAAVSVCISFSVFQCSPFARASPDSGRIHRTKSADSITGEDVAWAAGLTDGDGCIGAYEQERGDVAPTIRISLSICQNDLPTLLDGQRILAVKSAIYPVERTVQHNTSVHNLVYYVTKAIEALEKLAPRLRRKKLEALETTDLYYKGQVSLRPGRRGVPKELRKFRASKIRKIRKLK